MAARVSLGTTIAGFRLERLLGEGGMGVVYLALEEELGRQVALKLLPERLAEDEDFRERFLREAKLCASLDHPCVIPLYQAGEVEGQLFLAMRYVEGEDLGGLLDREGALGLEQALGLLSSLASALDAAHAQGLLHRDVKPQNVLLDGDGHVYLCDFGIARLQGATAFTQTGALTGTLAYLAPEVIEGKPASPASDLYALACLGYELLSGEPPFQAETEAALIYQQLKGAPPALASQPQLDPVFQRALAKDSESRYASCQAFLEALAKPRSAIAVPAKLAVNLPTPLTSFLGRERELADAAALLTETRLLTVTGPGGAGKTRFALELARRQSQGYPDGVHWVPLATLTDPTLVGDAIAQALGVKRELAEEIADQRLLVVLDNLEQLVDAAPELAQLLAACTNLTLVCTSRELLRVQPETGYQLPALEAEDGLSLFCERAGLEASDTIRELCERLEGLPLAIELAAARTRLLSPDQLLERLSQRLDLLTGMRDADPRQETLRATIDWSYELLTAVEQRLFARLSVFSGGCRLEAAETVCESDIKTLESLLDQSLVRKSGDRFAMLETIREYAAEKLEESGEADGMRQRHAEWFVAESRSAYAGLRGSDREAWIGRLDPEQANLRAAITWLIETEQADLLVELLHGNKRYWDIRGPAGEERREWYEQTLRLTEGQRTISRARVLVSMAEELIDRSDMAAAISRIDEGLAIFRELADATGIGWALITLGNARESTGQLAEAEQAYEEALVHLEAADNPDTIVVALNLALLAIQAGDHDRAISLLQRPLADSRDIGLPDDVANCLHVIGLAQLRARRPELAVLPARDSLELYERIGYRGGLLDSLILVSALAALRGEREVAARLLGAVEKFRREQSQVRRLIDASLFDDTARGVRGELGDERYETLVAEGAAMTLEEAVALALESVPEPPPVDIALPTPPTSFLGRERELAEAAGLLATSRLLMITGPGGAGKTRFAVELCRRQAQAYPDGVYWVPLATQTDPKLVGEAISRALEVQGEPAEEIGDQRLLLLLDNFEQLVDAAPELASLLAACPNLTLVCTSRELLRVQPETEYALAPLADAESVSLFCERSGLEPSDTIRELCARLEGLPLAIELAAARTRLLSPEQLLERLSTRLDLLKGTRDADPRQQTLRATIDWSYELLTSEEQRLFARLAVFSGGCTLEAAETVTDAELDTLESLLDKSLIRRRDDRFTMLETIREYATEKLGESDEEDELRQRHAEWFAALAAEVDEAMRRGGDQQELRARVKVDHDNLRAGLQWLHDSADADGELRLAANLAQTWQWTGHTAEGQEALDRALARDGDPEVKARALRAAGILARVRGDLDGSRKRHAQALELYRTLDDRQWVAVQLINLGALATDTHDYAEARALISESLDILRELDDVPYMAIALMNLGSVANSEGDYGEGARLTEEALVYARQINNETVMAICLFNLAFAAFRQGQMTDALRHGRESLAQANELGLVQLVAMDLVLISAVTLADHRTDVATRLLDAVEAAIDEAGVVLPPNELSFLEETKAQLPEQEPGEPMSLEQAVACALDS